MSVIESFLKLFRSPPPPVPPPPPPIILKAVNKTMVCPFCQHTITSLFDAPEPEKCDRCAAELPPEYRQGHANAPAMFCPVLGYKRHGKSNYLLALIWTLKRMQLFWKGARLQALSKETTVFLHQAEFLMGKRQDSPELLERQIARKTSELLQDPLIMKLNDMAAGWGTRTLVVRDFAGEHFNPERFRIPDPQLPFLQGQRGSAVMFMFDLGESDEEGDPSETQGYANADELVDMYARTLFQKCQIDIERPDQQRVGIVVLSKADTIPDLPEHLANYVRNDPFRDLLWPTAPPPVDATGQPSGVATRMGEEAMGRYFRAMDDVSREIEAWLTNHPKYQMQGEALVAALRQRNMTQERNTLRFCLTTLGADPRTKQPKPSRILDPFFYALRLAPPG